MLEQITTAEELDALHRAISDAAEPALVRAMTALWIIREGEDGELSAGSAYSDGEGLIPASMVQLPWTVLFRPDAPTEPARCAPSREDLAAALKAHNFSRMTCLDHSHYGVSCDEVCHGVTDNQYLHHADAVQALYASQRTEAEVKAEALKDFQTSIRPMLNCELRPDGSEDPRMSEWIEAHREMDGLLQQEIDRLATSQPAPDVDDLLTRLLALIRYWILTRKAES